ncbi:hypothetical protein M407DRAFT_244566 [Tulasnella calospora MUT 4182]|uniref:Uncharacterized protein n=1 Tax=Tulasnella calospora MUT 4182 TaxID=1051891 RepID=A0A0C3LRR8_9AGAM|nr:hypothetical protein M407DRAFT_244566 [Tulasnella calospora MUT 4182]
MVQRSNTRDRTGIGLKYSHYLRVFLWRAAPAHLSVMDVSSMRERAMYELWLRSAG